MEMTIQNFPFIYLLWITIGVLLILIGVFMLVAHENAGYYTSIEDKKDESKEDLEGILSYFLEEEEKKNQGFREMLESYAKQMGNKNEKNIKQSMKNSTSQYVNEIVTLADKGFEIEEIARQLGKGVGEVQLILSLYKMR
ncbi:DUF6115 domain-containing protein [Cellulosilyticum ruminicola]|uniref:DUF6115 domain-containing protein n=1 Tax=Cellulosilyticum ruminicola TaxID=425254 RepID=UPI0006D117EC|nr:hypothetical protein [Cellulosilyticum ruminicola]